MQNIYLPSGILNYHSLQSESSKIITEIAGIQAAILSCQLKEMLSNVASQDTSQGMYKLIKLVYHPREPFFVVKQVKYVYDHFLFARMVKGRVS